MARAVAAITLKPNWRRIEIREEKPTKLPAPALLQAVGDGGIARCRQSGGNRRHEGNRGRGACRIEERGKGPRQGPDRPLRMGATRCREGDDGEASRRTVGRTVYSPGVDRLEIPPVAAKPKLPAAPSSHEVAVPGLHGRVGRQEARTITGDRAAVGAPDASALPQSLQARRRRYLPLTLLKKDIAAISVPRPARGATRAALPGDYRRDAHWRSASAQMRRCRRDASGVGPAVLGSPVSLTRRRSRPRLC